MLRTLSKVIMWIIGWKVTGAFPSDLKKSMVVVIPHTSNWDFPLGIMSRAIIKTRVVYLMKDSMFKPPFGWFFRWMDGMPVIRSKSTNFVDAIVEMYNKEEELHIQIAPEGTRKWVKDLKTGFYYIALGAKIPLLLVKFDYGEKVVDFGKVFYPTGDKEADFKVIKEYFRDVKGKNPKDAWGYEP